MWSPTHIQVTVLGAKGLLTKGKNGTNNCFVTIGLGKEKFQTSVKEKVLKDVAWREECELTIPERGNRAELALTCLHRNNLGMDEFLGQVTLPLNEMDAYERPQSRWYKLQSKPGKEKKDKERGELEVRIAFTVKAGSLTDLSKKEKNKSSTLGLGGSLLSLGTLEKRKSLKKFAKSLGSKVHISGKSKKDKANDNDSISGSVSSISTPGSGPFPERRFGGGQAVGEADPGVISEDEDEFVFDNLSNKSSASSINLKPKNTPQMPPSQSPLAIHSTSSIPHIVSSSAEEDIKLRSKTLTTTAPSKPPRTTSDTPQVDEWEAKLYGKHLDGSSDSLKRRSWDSRVPLSAVKNGTEEFHAHERNNASTTAPTSPNLDEQKHHNHRDEKPQPLPRSGTLDSIVEKEQDSAAAKDKKSDKRFTSKLKYFRKDKNEAIDDIRLLKNGLHQKQFGERIIIGHENDFLKQVEVSPELLNKYEGKSREEIILLANDLENEVRFQKMKIKEMEDYLDNLLLRVMETQPKLLQNPYRNQSSTKSG